MAGNDDEWRHTRHVVYKLYAHIVLTPKYRRKVMTKRVSDLIETTCEQVCNNLGIEMLEYKTDQDHAHLLISYPPKLALSVIVMRLKTVSSLRLRQQQWEEVEKALWGKHFWSSSYAVVSTGSAYDNRQGIYQESTNETLRIPRPHGRGILNEDLLILD